MARIKIDLPDKFSFTTSIPVRITDINYGGHVGNDAVLSLIHEARMRFLKQWGYSELEFGGAGLIMADAAIEFRNELFYGDIVNISIACVEFSKVSFNIYYKLEKTPAQTKDEKRILIASAKTGMVCYDYSKKRIAALPEEVFRNLQ